MKPQDEDGDEGRRRGPDPLRGAEAQEAALRAELNRLRDLGAGLGRLSAEAAKLRDPEALARLQDRNLAAFEAMVSAQGLAALDRMRRIVAVLRAESAPSDSAGAARSMSDLLAEAQMAIRADRKNEMEKLLGRIGESFRAAGAQEDKNKNKDINKGQEEDDDS